MVTARFLTLSNGVNLISPEQSNSKYESLIKEINTLIKLAGNGSTLNLKSNTDSNSRHFVYTILLVTAL